jgi:glycosyltransferase involved in cell wall biosynthesis
VSAPPPSVSVVLPAYNEEDAIQPIVEATAAALRANGVPDPEIIVIDDGSRDATVTRARQARAEGVEVRVVSHTVNRGYGAALRTGFEAATRDAVWLMDADGQFDPADLRVLLAAYAPDRVVAGSRLRRSDPLFRRAANAAFFTVVRATVGSVARDINCGFKLFPRKVGVGLRADGAMISTELLLRAQRSGYRIVDVAVPHYPRRTGRATGADARVVARAFRELWGLRRDPEALRGLDPP